MRMKKFIQQHRLVLIYIAIWFLLCIVPLSVFHFSMAKEAMQFKMEILMLLTYRIALILFVFYLHYFFIIPNFFFTRQYRLYALSIVAIFIFSTISSMFLSKWLFPLPPILFNKENFMPNSHFPLPPRFPIPPYLINPFSSIFLVAISLFTSFSIKINKQYQTVMQTKLASELAWLKAQINPHFLFNALNSLYVLSIKKSEKTPEAILQLSEMMRYIIADLDNNKVLLEKELSYISNYIAIQKLRLAPTVNLNYTVNGLPNNLQIAPLILISFIENAFKYGISTTDFSPINIHITILNNTLTLSTYNKIFHRNKTLTVGAGIGISNTKKRLELLYPTKYNLNINETPTEYNLLLNINI